MTASFRGVQTNPLTAFSQASDELRWDVCTTEGWILMLQPGSPSGIMISLIYSIVLPEIACVCVCVCVCMSVCVCLPTHADSKCVYGNLLGKSQLRRVASFLNFLEISLIVMAFVLILINPCFSLRSAGDSASISDFSPLCLPVPIIVPPGASFSLL